MNRDGTFGLIAGFMIGLFLIPFAANTGLIDKIPYPYVSLLVALPIAASLGTLIARWIGTFVPVIWQVAKFGLIGLLNTAIDLGILNLMIFATGFTQGWQLASLNAVSFAVAVTNSYWWNKKWVFEDTGGGRQATQFVEFIVISVLAAGISSGIVGGLTAYVSPPLNLSSIQWANVAKGVAVVFSFIWNFVGYKFIVFRRA